VELFNRGKRSVGIDLKTESGRELLMVLVERADVFLTSLLPSARRRLGIDVDDVRARNPRIIYGRGSAHGAAGEQADVGGFDGATYWSRSGMAAQARPADYGYPIELLGPGFGDTQSAMHLVGGVAAALFRRDRTGEGSVVDVSLLASGMWAMQASLCVAHIAGVEEAPKYDHRHPANPLVNMYRTADDRYVRLSMLQADLYWPGLCEAIGREELLDDGRFATAADRMDHVEDVVDALDAIFAERPLDHWVIALGKQRGQWAVVTRIGDLLHDPQVEANGLLRHVRYDNGAELPIVNPPVQFDEMPAPAGRAPECGEHTDEVLRAHGLSDEQLIQLKVDGVIS
jgi:crotonobetainyl-CoA:carnitine CoA-transferase CaiB-like acyl-CoA transferase